MRARRLFAVFALIAGLAVGVTAAPAAACSCMEADDERSFEAADAVFTGEAVEFLDEADRNAYVVRVDSVFKGEVTGWQRLVTAIDSGECGVLLPLDTPVVIFGHSNSTTNSFTIDLCDPHRPIDATDVLFPDVEPYPPEPGGQLPDSMMGDAPEPVEDTTPGTNPPSEPATGEPPTSPDDQPTISPRDQAELDATQAMGDTPNSPDGAGTGGSDGLPLWLGAVLGLAVVVLVAEIVRSRRRPTP